VTSPISWARLVGRVSEQVIRPRRPVRVVAEDLHRSVVVGDPELQ
jgi:hypothetical protein